MTEQLSLWDDYMERGEAELERVRKGTAVVERDACPVEPTPYGLIRWYTHPRLTGPVSTALYQYELEIPARSRTGLVQHQGGVVHYVIEGIGLTEMDGKEHAWEAGDVIGIPARAEGVTFRHVNAGLVPVRMMVAQVNLDSAIGAFLGVRTVVLEPAPEFGSMVRA